MYGEDDICDEDLEPPPPLSNECIVHSPSHTKIGIYASTSFVKDVLEDREKSIPYSRIMTDGYVSKSIVNESPSIRSRIMTDGYVSKSIVNESPKIVRRSRIMTDGYVNKRIVNESPKIVRRETKKTLPTRRTSEEALKEALILYSSPYSNKNGHKQRSPIHESLTKIKNALEDGGTTTTSPPQTSNLDDVLSSIHRMQCHIQRMRGSSKHVV